MRERDMPDRTFESDEPTIGAYRRLEMRILERRLKNAVRFMAKLMRNRIQLAMLIAGSAIVIALSTMVLSFIHSVESLE